jgi:hypothetical protein
LDYLQDLGDFLKGEEGHELQALVIVLKIDGLEKEGYECIASAFMHEGDRV